MAPAQTVTSAPQGSSSLDKALLNDDEKTRLAALYLREQLDPEKAFDNAVAILKGGQETSRKIKGACANTVLRLANESNIAEVIDVVEKLLSSDEDRKILSDITKNGGKDIPEEILSRIRLLIQNPALVKLQDGAERLQQSIRTRTVERLRSLPLVRELFTSLRASIPAFRTYLEIMGRKREFTRDSSGKLLSDEPTYRATRRIAPALTALLKDPQNQRLFRLAATEHINTVRESYWEKLRAGEEVFLNEIIIGAGPTSTNYRSTRSALAPNDTILAIDGRPLPGGQFADVENSVFRLNSRNRPEGRLTREALPGTESPLNTLGPYVPLQAADISSDLYGTQKDFGLIILANQIVSGDTLCSTRVLEVELNTTEEKGKYEVKLRNELTGEVGSVFTDRVVSARGIGSPSLAVDIDNDVQTRLLLETSREQPKVTPFGQYITAAEFTRVLGDTTNPFPLKDIERIVIIGGGDSANTSIEAALGLGPTIGLGSSTLDRVEEIAWVGQSIETKEEWDRCNRDRYVQIGLEFPREGNEKAPYRIQPIASRAKFLRLNPKSRELELTLENGNTVGGQLFIDCSGYKRFDVMDLIGESLQSTEIIDETPNEFAEELGANTTQTYTYGIENTATRLRDGLQFSVETVDSIAAFEVGVSKASEGSRTIYSLELKDFNGKSRTIRSVRAPVGPSGEESPFTLDDLLNFEGLTTDRFFPITRKADTTRELTKSIGEIFAPGTSKIIVPPINSGQPNALQTQTFTYDPTATTVPVRDGLKFVAEIDGFSAEFKIGIENFAVSTEYALLYRFGDDSTASSVAVVRRSDRRTLDLCKFLKQSMQNRINSNKGISLRKKESSLIKTVNTNDYKEIFVPGKTKITVLNQPTTADETPSSDRPESFLLGLYADTTPISDGLKFKAEIDGYSTTFEIRDRTNLLARNDVNTYALYEAEDPDAESPINSLDVINNGTTAALPSFLANGKLNSARMDKKIRVSNEEGVSRFLTYDEIFVSGDTRITVLEQSPDSNSILSPDLQKGFRLGVDPCIISLRDGLRFEAKTDDYQASFTVGVTEGSTGFSRYIEYVVYEGQEVDPSKVISRKIYDVINDSSVSLERVLRQVDPSTQIEAITIDESPTQTRNVRFDQIVFNGVTDITLLPDAPKEVSEQTVEEDKTISQSTTTEPTGETSRVYIYGAPGESTKLKDGLTFRVKKGGYDVKFRVTAEPYSLEENRYTYYYFPDSSKSIAKKLYSFQRKKPEGLLSSPSLESTLLPNSLPENLRGKKLFTDREGQNPCSLASLLTVGVTELEIQSTTTAIVDERVSTSKQLLFGRDEGPITIRDGLELEIDGPNSTGKVRFELVREDPSTNTYDYDMQFVQTDGTNFYLDTVITVGDGSIFLKDIFGNIPSTLLEKSVKVTDKILGETSRPLNNIFVPGITKISVPEESITTEEIVTTEPTSSGEYTYGVSTDGIEVRDGLEFRAEDQDVVAYFKVELQRENDTTGEAEYKLKAIGLDGEAKEISTFYAIRGQTLPINEIFPDALYESATLIKVNSKKPLGDNTKFTGEFFVPSKTKISVLGDGVGRRERAQFTLDERERDRKKPASSKEYTYGVSTDEIELRDGLEFKVQGPDSIAYAQLIRVEDDPFKAEAFYILELRESSGNTVILNRLGDARARTIGQIFSIGLAGLGTSVRVSERGKVDTKLSRLDELFVEGRTKVSILEKDEAAKINAQRKQARETKALAETDSLVRFDVDSPVPIPLGGGLRFRIETPKYTGVFGVRAKRFESLGGFTEYTLFSYQANGGKLDIKKIKANEGEVKDLELLLQKATERLGDDKPSIAVFRNSLPVQIESINFDKLIAEEDASISILSDAPAEEIEAEEERPVEQVQSTEAVTPAPSIPRRVPRDLTLEDIQGVVNGDEIVLAKKVSGEEIYVLGPESQVPLSDEEKEKSGINTISPNLVAVFLYSSRATGFAEITPELATEMIEAEEVLERQIFTADAKVGELESISLGPVDDTGKSSLPYDLDTERAIALFMQYAFRDQKVIVPDALNPEVQPDRILFRFIRKDNNVELSIENISIGPKPLEILKEKIIGSQAFLDLCRSFAQKPWATGREGESTVLSVPLTIFTDEPNRSPFNSRLRWEDATVSKEQQFKSVASRGLPSAEDVIKEIRGE